MLPVGPSSNPPALSAHEIGARQALDAVNLLGIGTWEYLPDPDQLFVSPQMRRLMVFPNGPLNDLALAFSAEDRPTVRGMIKSVVSTLGIREGEFRVQTPRGRERMILIVCRAVEEPMGTRVVGVCQDVTDWRSSEVGLRDREERWKLALQGSNFGVWDWDLRTNRLTLSGYLVEMLGYPADHQPGPFDLWTKYLHPEDRRPTLIAIRDHIRGRTPSYRMEHRLRHRDGTYRWVLSRGSAVLDESGHPYRLTGIATDINRRVETRLALEASEARLRAVFDGSFDGIVLLRALRNEDLEIVDFTIADLNGPARTILAPNGEEVVGRSLIEVYPEVIENGNFVRFRTVVERNGRDLYEGEICERLGHGRRFRMQVVPSVDGVAVTLSDVTERRQNEVLLAASEKLISEIASSVPEYLYVFDAVTNRVTYHNRSLRAALGYDSAPGHLLEDLAALQRIVHTEDLESFLTQVRAVREHPEEGHREAELRVVRADGGVEWLSIRYTPFAIGPDGRAAQMLASVSFITDKKEAEERVRAHVMELHRTQAELQARHSELQRLNDRLSHLARKDGLTEVYNHRAFQERLAEEVARSRRSGHPLSLILADVDDFKAFNDRFGHVAGDERLQYFAAVLERSTRPSDFVARYGGEEFAIILPEASAAQGVVVGERILQLLGEETGVRRISASLGIAEFGADVPTPTALIAAADSALYLAKQTGKNRVVVAKPGTRLG